jgi:hypothetical protein
MKCPYCNENEFNYNINDYAHHFHANDYCRVSIEDIDYQFIYIDGSWLFKINKSDAIILSKDELAKKIRMIKLLK